MIECLLGVCLDVDGEMFHHGIVVGCVVARNVANLKLHQRHTVMKLEFYLPYVQSQHV
jgi:hypothetical protein